VDVVGAGVCRSSFRPEGLVGDVAGGAAAVVLGDSGEAVAAEGLEASVVAEGSVAEAVVPAGNEGRDDRKRNRRDHACVK
jgi:hypothetical protein